MGPRSSNRKDPNSRIGELSRDTLSPTFQKHTCVGRDVHDQLCHFYYLPVPSIEISTCQGWSRERSHMHPWHELSCSGFTIHTLKRAVLDIGCSPTWRCWVNYLPSPTTATSAGIMCSYWHDAGWFSKGFAIHKGSRWRPQPPSTAQPLGSLTA